MINNFATRQSTSFRKSSAVFWTKNETFGRLEVTKLVVAFSAFSTFNVVKLIKISTHENRIWKRMDNSWNSSLRAGAIAKYVTFSASLEFINILLENYDLALVIYTMTIFFCRLFLTLIAGLKTIQPWNDIERHLELSTTF